MLNLTACMPATSENCVSLNENYVFSKKTKILAVLQDIQDQAGASYHLLDKKKSSTNY